MRGLAQSRGIAERIAQVIGNLEGFADASAELFPGFGVLAGGERAHLGRGDEQRAGLGLVVGGKVDAFLAFPALPGADAVGHAGTTAKDADEPERAGRIGHRRAGQDVEGQHDEAVAGQHGERFGKGAVGGGTTAADIGIVKHRQVVVHEAGAVDEFERGGGGIGKRGTVIAAGERDGGQDRRADARPAGGGGMVQRGGKAGGRRTGLADADGAGDGGFDAVVEVHRGRSVLRFPADCQLI